jgi:hypothetical protein
MARQTYAGPVRWVVVDDGQKPTTIPEMPGNWSVVHVRPEPFWRPSQNTHARNLLAGLDHFDGAVAFAEDDDYYASDWLDTVARELDRCDLVGERNTRYYNVATGKGREMRNTAHASLCATAARGKALDTLRAVLASHGTRIDIELWRRHRGHLFDGHRVVGIKGLPGRGGIGVGHRATFGDPMDLRDWIGEDANAYSIGPP